ncbi:probable thiopurine S-methyltransferase [Physella acuta]|uniref:probable thiopurine S-methyltransferase n=1 Tax=Physella acuta TaxID=109671 RepID=UPI0027DBDC1B|nr:probable thiopurine S-methyltransferase [Physella acuta]XP_059174986.1 probable thiopurine S-methyltransferase [Physella acuta]XP_059174987.1 probable thiopurine S-methyltransferase [Physella acuta]XP_059174988.1 probable thiopurine S-methyltransferase [Physella acuta]
MDNLPKRVEFWKDRWDDRHIGFHQADVHKMLSKHFTKLIPDGKANKVFFPLCGKAVDMSWLASQGYNIVGVDGVKKALEEFFTDQGIEYSVEDVNHNGHNFKLFKSKDGKIRLYCTDIFNFTPDIEGTFDAVWDRGALVALNREDVSGYVKNMKKLLSPNGRILMEVMEYDVSIMDGLEGPSKPPPPHPMYEDQIKALYEPECEVHFIERDDRQIQGRDVNTAIYNIIKLP